MSREPTIALCGMGDDGGIGVSTRNRPPIATMPATTAAADSNAMSSVPPDSPVDHDAPRARRRFVDSVPSLNDDHGT